MPAYHINMVRWLGMVQMPSMRRTFEIEIEVCFQDDPTDHKATKAAAVAAKEAFDSVAGAQALPRPHYFLVPRPRCVSRPGPRGFIMPLLPCLLHAPAPAASPCLGSRCLLACHSMCETDQPLGCGCE